MEVLGLIPARLHSKGIARKSLTPLAGRPLIEYTFDAARAARSLTRVVVSTDDPDVVALATAHGVDAPFIRPSSLAEDDTPMLAVMRHAIEWLRQAERYESAIVVLLQPTSPLRQARHIDAGVQQLVETGADVAVSVVAVPHNFVPESLMVEKGGWLTLLAEGKPLLHRQDKPRYLARNGPAVLAARTSHIESCGHLYDGRVTGYLMEPSHSIDIDGAADLLDAEHGILRLRQDETARRG